MIVVINNNEDVIKVQLYNKDSPEARRRGFNEDYEDKNIEISNLVHTVIDIALNLHDMQLDDNKLEGEVNSLVVNTDPEMVVDVLQIAEKIILSNHEFEGETNEEIRHKILDRLIAFYML